jgi:hypothetical protein
MSTPVNASAVRSHYEALRREALGAAPDGAPSHGLALFLLRGMSAWCAALTALGPPRATPRSHADHLDDPPPTSAPDTRAILTTVLASMVLACLPEEGVAC